MGTMRERSSGTWELTVSTGRDPATGKYGRVVRTIEARGKRQAKTALGRLEFEVQAGQVVAKDPTFTELLDRWMAHVNRWARTRKLADVPKTIRVHDLRRWQATQLLDAGVPVPTVAARLGHADGTTTMKVYAHRTKRADEQAASVVGDALKRRA